MDAFALFAIPFLMVAGAHEAMLAERYAAGGQYGQSYVYAVPPGSGWAPGAAIGAGVGALASGGHAGPAVAGALIGGAIGYAATTPPVYVAPVAYAPPAYAAPAYAPPARSRPAPSRSSDAFIANWMSFMQPAGR